jgi:hypothetical protein
MLQALNDEVAIESLKEISSFLFGGPEARIFLQQLDDKLIHRYHALGRFF